MGFPRRRGLYRRYIQSLGKRNKVYIDNPTILIENPENIIQLIDDNSMNLGIVLDLIRLNEVKPIINHCKPELITYKLEFGVTRYYCGCNLSKFFYCR